MRQPFLFIRFMKNIIAAKAIARELAGWRWSLATMPD